MIVWFKHKKWLHKKCHVCLIMWYEALFKKIKYSKTLLHYLSSHMNWFFNFFCTSSVWKVQMNSDFSHSQENLYCHMKGQLRETCWQRSEEQHCQVIWLLAQFQPPTLKIVAKYRASFTPSVSSRARSGAPLSSSETIYPEGKLPFFSYSLQARARLSLAQKIGAAEHVDLFFCRIHITRFFFLNKWVSASVLRCVFLGE